MRITASYRDEFINYRKLIFIGNIKYRIRLKV